jgi:hypothetical protein
MSDISNKQASGTFSQLVVIAGLFAAQAFPPLAEEGVVAKRNMHLPYLSNCTQATFDLYSNPITGNYTPAKSTFEQKIGNFYAKLSAKQEPLGADFEKVLYDSLWDLYES